MSAARSRASRAAIMRRIGARRRSEMKLARDHACALELGRHEAGGGHLELEALGELADGERLVQEDLPDRGEVALGDVRGGDVRLQDVAELAHLATPDGRHASER
jgi:hypothetical protein